MSNQEELPIPFEKALADLEAVVRALESGELPLDQAIDKFQSGIQLVKMCREQLQSAELKVELVIAGEKGIIMRPFEVEEA